MLLINCSHCTTALQLPPSARSIKCSVCRHVTLVSLPTPTSLSTVSAPSPHGPKRAVIVGISYRHSRHELKGCVNDAKCMRYMLCKRFGFPEYSVIMLTEEETDPDKIPTKSNIRRALHWLVQGCQTGDSLLFHYSGHGSQQRNYNGEERDGYDETLCPLDFETQGMIVDDEINATIVQPLPHGVKLHAIIDSCHSGTMLDLPFLCRMDRTRKYTWEDHRPPTGTWKGTRGGEAFSFSGCDDNETSADTSALSRITSTGAMTFSFIEAIEKGHGATYGSILTYIRSNIRNKNEAKPGRPLTTVLNMLLTSGVLSGRFRQEPQLSSNYQFDVYKKPFLL